MSGPTGPAPVIMVSSSVCVEIHSTWLAGRLTWHLQLLYEHGLAIRTFCGKIMKMDVRGRMANTARAASKPLPPHAEVFH